MRHHDDRPSPEGAEGAEGTDASRRVMLIASGGLMLAIATAVGWPSADLGSGALSQGHSRTSRPNAMPGSSPRASRSIRVASTEVPKRPARHRRQPAGHPTGQPTTGGTSTTGTTAPAEPVYYLDDGPMTIALTIDDGPSPVYTPQILRILDKYHVTASFSMVGENVTYYPGIARDVADAGHVIVNHTWDHSDLTRMTASRARTEIAQATDAIHAAVGERPTLFRAPYGAWSKAVLEYCAAGKLTPVDWSVDPRDWARPGVSRIVSNIMRNTRTGSIILEHDGGGDRSETVAALKKAIPRLLDQGYRFRTV